MQIEISKHAKKRMIKWHINKKDIFNTIEKGEQIKAKEDRIKIVYKNIELITVIKNNVITIITAHYTHKFIKKAEKLAKKQKITIRKAIKILLDSKNNEM